MHSAGHHACHVLEEVTPSDKERSFMGHAGAKPFIPSFVLTLDHHLRVYHYIDVTLYPSLGPFLPRVHAYSDETHNHVSYRIKNISSRQINRNMIQHQS